MTNTIRPVVVASLLVNGEAQDAFRNRHTGLSRLEKGQPEG